MILHIEVQMFESNSLHTSTIPSHYYKVCKFVEIKAEENLPKNINNEIRIHTINATAGNSRIHSKYLTTISERAHRVYLNSCFDLC